MLRNVWCTKRPWLTRRLPWLLDLAMRTGTGNPIQGGAPAPFTSPPDLASTVPAKCDYLRVYYSDFLSQQPTEEADRPTYADSQKASIESEELQKWILDSHPRSRTETYPLYLLTKDVLRRVTTDKCTIINTTLNKLRAELAALSEAKAQGERAAEQARQQLQQQIADLEQALQEERAQPRGGSDEDMKRLAQMDEQIAELKRALDAALKEAAKATEQAEPHLSTPYLPLPPI